MRRAAVAERQPRPPETLSRQAASVGFLGTVGPVSVAPLADGLLGGKTVTCPLHERVYDLATGRASAGACDLRTYSVHLGEDGSIALLTLPGDTPGTPWQWSGSAPEP